MEDIKRQKLEDVANSLDNTKIALKIDYAKRIKTKTPTNASNNFFIYNSRATCKKYYSRKR